MGVPALFRWLSKKYSRIVLPVVEDEEQKMSGEDGEEITVPIDFSAPNPNGTEFDNLYLDMNGIVHPCTHPEGKPAPETEEEMMVEIFKYTERVVNMVRPRKLLLMAIDGVAPRAKMNQQRSRRFRASQEAKDKEQAREESLLLWESMGQNVTDEMRNKKTWDSNAITPGTPFMDLLAKSLRYWVVQRMNTDPGWKNLEVIISDASVPGEGEHKIMDFIRRQRSNPGHDPNTRHVIYGLDADLIMLSLATHEPHFRVLREDVFFQDTSSTACRTCGQEGHYAAQCTGEAKIKADEHDTKTAPITKKPFIFLDVPTLREYLEIELNVPNVPFPFDFERAIDDWVLLIFFVGNDFLPHLPSLEIREGAIDTLLKIWKRELPRMGGYITNHGKLEYDRAGLILEGVAREEDHIFRRRREAEERQEQNAKRRKIEAEQRKNGSMMSVKPSASLQLSGTPSVPPGLSGPHGLPPRPNFDSFENAANSLGFGAPGAGSDSLDKRQQVRTANLSAAEMLKAEMMTATPMNPDAWKKGPTEARATAMQVDVAAKATTPSPMEPVSAQSQQSSVDENVPGTGEQHMTDDSTSEAKQIEQPTPLPDGETADGDSSPRGVKRKIDDVDAEGEDDEDYDLGPDDEEEDAPTTKKTLTLNVNPDGTVEQEDTVKLWEPGYKERYYMQKFGVEYSDTEFRRKITTSYIEGMSWVLQYYYQGTPSWTWYYPYHFAPFAADFWDLGGMDIKFDLGQPFKPFEQLMGVFPAASRQHIPEVFHCLMTDTDSPIIDFYPKTFEIDMNGKRMAWQGVALLPFIDEKRLLDAMHARYEGLTEEEVRRNTWGNNAIYVADEHPLYPSLESLYAKRKDDKPVPIDPNHSKGLNGSLLPDPACVPGSTYESPLMSQGLEDISGDCSLAALYLFPKQLVPHHSVLLPGVRRPPRVLGKEDFETIRSGGRGRGRGRDVGFHAINSGREGYGRGPQRNGYGNGQSYGGYGGNGRNGGYGGQGGGYGGQGGGYGGQGGGYGGYGGGSNAYPDRGLPPPRGRGDYSKPGYGGPPSRSTYQAEPVGGAYGRQSSAYQGSGGPNTGYGRPPPPPSYGGGSSGRGGGYGQTQSYSSGYNSNAYGGNSRDRYGGYGNTGSGGASSYGGYGGSRSDASGGGYGGSGGGYGGGRGGSSASAGQYGQSQTNYGGYGRGTPQSSYAGRGRGYGRY